MRRVVEERVGGDAGERAAVVAGGRGVGVEDLAEAVRAGVGDAGKTRGQDGRERGPAEDRKRQGEEREDGHLDLLRLELLAEIFGRAPDHEARHEHRDDGEGEDAVEARADAAEDHLAELDVDQRHHAAQRHEAVVHRVDRAARRIGGDGGAEREFGDAEADLLAFHVAAGLRRARRRVDVELRRRRDCRATRPSRQVVTPTRNSTPIAAKIAQPWRWSSTMRPKTLVSAAPIEKIRPHLR